MWHKINTWHSFIYICNITNFYSTPTFHNCFQENISDGSKKVCSDIHFLQEETYSDNLSTFSGNFSLVKFLILLNVLSQWLFFNPFICKRIFQLLHSLILCKKTCSLFLLSPSLWLQNANIKQEGGKKETLPVCKEHISVVQICR